MATGNVTLAANTSGGPDGARSFGPWTITTPTAITETLPVALSVGANTIAVPAGATVMVVIPPNLTSPGVPAPNPAYGGTLTLKGITGDTGVPLSVKYPSMV